MTAIAIVYLFGAASVFITGCEPSRNASQNTAPAARSNQEPATMTIEVSSPAFKNHAAMAKRYTGDGEDLSPALAWTGVPSAAKELALICDDPDAPTPEPWVHWVIYKIPVSAIGLREHVDTIDAPPDPKGALQGKNSWGHIGYRGPAPPPGKRHHYHFKLYALDMVLSVEAGLTKSKLLAAMKGHIVATGDLTGTYQR